MSSLAVSWPATVFSSAVTVITYLLIKLVRVRRWYKDLPKPPHDMFWGHLKLFGEVMRMFPEDIHYQAAITTISQKYNLPGLWYLDLWPFGPSQAIITDPDLALQVTVFQNHPKHEIEAKFMDPVIGEGNVATTNGPIWKAARNMLSPAFSVSHVRNMVPMIAGDVMEFRSILQQRAQSGEVFGLEDLIRNLVFDATGTVSFESSLGAQKDGSLLLDYFAEALKANATAQNSWNPIEVFFARGKRSAMVQKMSVLLEDLIRERFDKVQRDGVDMSRRRGLCIMDLILREHLGEMEKNGMKAPDPKFVTMAATHVKALLLAGTGSTTSTLSFTYMLLSVHPEVVERLRTEHDTIFAPGVEASYAIVQQQPHKLNDLQYTTNVIKEVLRFYPIGNTARAALSSGQIIYNGKTYPTRGLMIAPIQHAMHMNPDVFPNASKFDPDRFSRGETARTAWRPFERGPRGCIGQSLAMDMMRVTLLLTVRDFDFTCAGLKPSNKPLVPWMDLDLSFGDRAFQRAVLEAKPRDGVPMTVKLAG